MPGSPAAPAGHRVLPLPPGVDAKPQSPELLERDLRTLALFVKIYCHAHDGPHAARKLFALKGFDLAAIAGKPFELCPECTRLLAHAFIKRTHCPYDPKPQCKHCPTHCYQKDYRAKIQEVMRFSGKRMVLHGRVDYLYHLFF